MACFLCEKSNCECDKKQPCSNCLFNKHPQMCIYQSITKNVDLDKLIVLRENDSAIFDAFFIKNLMSFLITYLRSLQREMDDLNRELFLLKKKIFLDTLSIKVNQTVLQTMDILASDISSEGEQDFGKDIYRISMSLVKNIFVRN